MVAIGTPPSSRPPAVGSRSARAGRSLARRAAARRVFDLISSLVVLLAVHSSSSIKFRETIIIEVRRGRAILGYVGDGPLRT